MDLEEVWRIREEEVYPALFGPHVRGIFPLRMEMFTGQFSQSKVDPRWLHYGVLEFAPTEARPSWLYVTSGHSNPWNQSPGEFDPDGQSGAGVEFTLATKLMRTTWACRSHSRCRTHRFLVRLIPPDQNRDDGNYNKASRDLIKLSSAQFAALSAWLFHDNLLDRQPSMASSPVTIVAQPLFQR